MQTNNRLIKQICENYNITVEGTHTDNYYLRKIATEQFNCSYSELESNNKYLKDIAEAITGGSYSETHFDNFYLKKIAEFLSSETYGKNFDNFYLKIWANGDVPPTPPSFDGISLSTDKSILSYLDNESATLSAQLLDSETPISISDVSVEFFNGSTSLGTATTNDKGIATKTYTATGIGNINITATSENITSSEIHIEDCLYYDNATTDKSSNYDTTPLNGNLTFSTDHYIISPSTGAKGLLVDDLLVSNSVQIDCDVKINAQYNEQLVLALYKSSNTTGIGACSMISPKYSQSKVMVRSGCTMTGLGSEVSTSNHTHSSWHHLTLICQDGSVTAKFNDTEQTITSSYTFESSNKVGFTTYSGNASATFEFKNLKVKQL